LTETLDIQVVIDGCIANNRKAQEYLYRQYYSYAMVIAQRYSRDDADAADIVSQTFVKVFKSIKSFNSSIASFQTWFRRIVINEGLDHIKARSKFSQEMELEYETVAAPNINNAAIEQLNAKELMTMIQQLPPATHAVFVLYAVDGYNHREIAEKLAISEGTSKWHLSEARKFLIQKLQQVHLS
jgi:RNA polymerase sigma-70 factor (ECF subfamily)